MIEGIWCYGFWLLKIEHKIDTGTKSLTLYFIYRDDY
jgi:hypothetical protein